MASYNVLAESMSWKLYIQKLHVKQILDIEAWEKFRLLQGQGHPAERPQHIKEMDNPQLYEI